MPVPFLHIMENFEQRIGPVAMLQADFSDRGRKRRIELD
jgi:hypothetical protein